MEDNKLPVLIRDFIPAGGTPIFSKDQTLIILQILTDSFKGFPAPVVGEKKEYAFGDPVGILVDATEAERLEQSWKQQNKPLAYYDKSFHSIRLA